MELQTEHHLPQAGTARELAFAVIGVGRMGANHVGTLAKIDGVKLHAVCDTNAEVARAAAVRDRVAAWYTDVDQMLAEARLDAVIIATSTQNHFQVACRCMDAGLNVLLEKPMSSTVDQCRLLIHRAEQRSVRLMIGHVERFNPAIRHLDKLLAEGLIGGVYYLETVRSGPFPRRLYGSKDGVILDLAVHDLDLVSFLAGDITQIYAHLIENGPSNQDVHARIMFETGRGVLGSSEFSWISPRRTRTVSVYGDRGLLVADLQHQEVWYYENGDADSDYSDDYFQNVLWGRVSEGRVVKFAVKRDNALQAELAAFCELIRDPQLEHDPAYGMAAVTYALSVLESARERRVITFGGGHRRQQQMPELGPPTEAQRCRALPS